MKHYKRIINQAEHRILLIRNLMQKQWHILHPVGGARGMVPYDQGLE